MTKQDLTCLAVILDRSGSMDQIKSDMEAGLNLFIREQRDVPGECAFSLVQFNVHSEIVEDYIPISKAKDFYPLIPADGTALWDAMGETITRLGKKFANMPEDERPGKVICVIITDGLENSSTEWRDPKVISNLVKEQQEKWNWDFVYLGANQDAIAVGDGLGVAQNSSMTFTATGAGVSGLYASTSGAVTRSRGTGQSVNYTDEEREAANKP